MYFILSANDKGLIEDKNILFFIKSITKKWNKTTKTITKKKQLVNMSSMLNKESKLYVFHFEPEKRCELDIPIQFKFIGYSEEKTSVFGNYRILFYKYASQYDDKNENSYLNLAKQLLEKQDKREDRTNIGTTSIFGPQLKFDLTSGTIPILTTKNVAWKNCLKELLWFLRGETNSKILEKQNVFIWNGNTSREFLDQRGLHYLPEGDIGALYSFQWRHFGAKYINCQTDYTGQGFDQLQYVIKELKQNPFSRRIVMSAWNPTDLNNMVLAPCHTMIQFYVEDDGNGKKYLSGHLYQRSGDQFLGEPFNIMSYSLLIHILALKTNMEAKELIISLGDAHLYFNHREQMKKQLKRNPRPFPKIIINEEVKTKEWDEIKLEDFKVIGYYPHPSIKAEMAV